MRRKPKSGMLSSGELSRHIGIDRTNIVRMAKRGAIPGHQFGSAWRFNLQEVLEATKVKTSI